jgi:hypothetical protein
MPDTADHFDVVKERVLAEFASQGFGTEPLSFQEAMRLRAYAKDRTDLERENLSMEQAIWKALYAGLTEELRRSSSESMTEIEALEKRRDNLEDLGTAIAARLNSDPHDFGSRVWWGFIIIGLLVGWMRSSDIWSIVLHGLAFFIAGMFFCIFAIESSAVQSWIAILVHKGVGDNRLSYWLYSRALGRNADGSAR